jgi:BirA family biotin operon repressor/biotin-[acetyl-CoA-carboxylase] ligase
MGSLSDPAVQWHAQVTSTNDVAAKLAERGAPEGVVVAADAQTAGRGRLGRVWVSPAGAGLYVSLVLRPRPDAAPLLTIAAGVALSDAIRVTTGLSPLLKWPNDLYVGTRKLAGILAEAGASPDGRPHVVLGFGINILPAAFPPDVAARATSLEDELGRAIDRHALLHACLAALAARYADIQEGRAEVVLAAWRARAAPLLRRPIEWEQGGRALRGVAETIDDTGALLVRTERGVERIISGEVRWI